MIQLLNEVRSEMLSRHLSASAAAAEMGVTPSTLNKHLVGEYVRSDSAAKYRRWLAGPIAKPARPLTTSKGPLAVDQSDEGEVGFALQVNRTRPSEPFRVVDLFSGGGGLSLGFDLADQGAAFDTVLAVDIEQSMLDVLDDNRSTMGRAAVGRRVDLSDLTCEAEALAFYLDHLSLSGQADQELKEALQSLPRGGLSAFKNEIVKLDSEALAAFRHLAKSPNARNLRTSVSSDSFRQTSVVSFHSSIGVPLPGASEFTPPMLWWGGGQSSSETESDMLVPIDLVKRQRKLLYASWRHEIDALREKALLRGSGQLASSSRRIAGFLFHVDNGNYDEIRNVWLDWRSQRDALRAWYFETALEQLRRTYQPWQVGVLVGGPPCQGFSRIGRGKIRSLRDSGAQAHVDSEAGDERNRLMFSYVLMVSALRPTAFVFENVRHFQSEVHTADGVFRAPEVLAEAIHEISSDQLNYGVSSRILKAADHGVPQARERFFMAGVKDGVIPLDSSAVAGWMLRLPRLEAVPLAAALAGLGRAHLTGEGGKTKDLSTSSGPLPKVPVSATAADLYMHWVTHDPQGRFVQRTDAHLARSPRSDDARWFTLMGPGTRWLDYRVDRSSTLIRLTSVLKAISMAIEEDVSLAQRTGLNGAEIQELVHLTDGSLALRLLLETLPTEDGELEHHLLGQAYLGKRDGNHGDWLARLAADKPCKTITSHMGKDTYSYVHPFEARTLSVREAARVQSFPDWFSFKRASLVDAFRIIGNAVPPLLSNQLAANVLSALQADLMTGEVTEAS